MVPTPDHNEQEFLDVSKEYFFDVAEPCDLITEEELEEYYNEWQQRQEIFENLPNNTTFEDM